MVTGPTAHPAAEAPDQSDPRRVRIRPLCPDEVNAACALFRDVFGQVMTPAHWRWKYDKAHALGAVNMVAVDDQGALVGHAGTTVWHGERGGQPLRLGQVCDVMVSPVFRGGLGPDSVYRRIMVELDRALQGLAPQCGPLYLYGFPGHTPARLGQRMGLYRLLGTRMTAVAPTAVPQGWGARRWWTACRLRAIPWGEALAQHDAWSAAVRHEAPSALRLIKDAAYLRWRYAQHPMFRYSYWLLRGWSGRVRGWLVTRQEPAPPHVVDAELAATLPLSVVLRALAGATGIDGWRSWLKSDLPLQPTPFEAIEFSGSGAFHSTWAPPDFQPGDTDVF